MMSWLKSATKYFISIFFLISIAILTVLIAQKHLAPKEPVAVPQPQIVFDHESALKRIEQLEKIVERQTFQIQRLETDRDLLTTVNRQLEKRQQFHTDTLRRMCEYIVVITVDKKILPRQCLSDYNWRREEGL